MKQKTHIVFRKAVVCIDNTHHCDHDPEHDGILS